VPVSGGLSFAEIVGHPSGYATCGRTAAGAAYCWGYNGDNELGDGTTTNRKVPTAVSGGNVFTALSGGAQHMCGLVAGGDWKCWGYNGYGELGDGTETTRSTPTSVQTGGQVFVQLALGSDHTCGRTAAGAVFCWGRNGSGELGTGNHVASDTPVPSAAGMLFTDIRAGAGFTCGLTAGGAVFCWGDNAWGQLGDDVVNSSSTPIRVPVPFGSGLRRR
jgi:alpha-tubulin suppressor-like RCC1 family protein